MNSITFEKDQYSITIDGREIMLTALQCNIIDLLYRNRGYGCRHADIAKAGWGTWVPDTHVHVMINKIRSKIGRQWIRTIKNHGYLFIQ